MNRSADIPVPNGAGPIDSALPKQPPMVRSELDPILTELESPSDAFLPGSELTLHLREIPAREIKDPQLKKFSDLIKALELDSVFVATNEVHRYIDLTGAIIGGDWVLNGLISHDNHSDLYSVKQGKPLALSPGGVERFVETEYEGRVFTFDGIPGSLADSRRRNLKRLAKSVHVMCMQHQDGRKILIYKPKSKPTPSLPNVDRQDHGRRPVPNKNSVLALCDRSEDQNIQRTENKRAKQQKRRQRQRESKNEAAAAKTPTCQKSAEAEPQETAPSSLQMSLKFVTGLYRFDNPKIDKTVVPSLSEEKWDTILHGSRTLRALRSPDLLHRNFEDEDDIMNFVQKTKKVVSELKRHSGHLPLLWQFLPSGASNDPLRFSIDIDLLTIKYGTRLLPLLVEAAESRHMKLAERAQLVVRAAEKFFSRRKAVNRIRKSTDIGSEMQHLVPRTLVPGTLAWNEAREEQKKTKRRYLLRKYHQVCHALRLKDEARDEYDKLLKPKNPLDDDDSDGENHDKMSWMATRR
jgi:hypothetical protein